MNKTWLVLLFSVLHFLNTCMAAPPPVHSSDFQDLIQQPNLTYPAFPSVFPKGSNFDTPHDRYHIPGTNIFLDFWHQEPSIARQHVLMCLIEGLSKVFGHASTEPLPGLSTFYYKRYAFVHIQDLDPTPGRAHTYGDMAATLRGVGEYMMEYNKFYTTEFQIWAITPMGQLKIGSGGVGGLLRSQGTAAVEMGLPAATTGLDGAVPSANADVGAL